MTSNKLDLDGLLRLYGDDYVELGAAPKSANSKHPDGDSLLHVAVYRNSRTECELLIASGADVNYRGALGQTPLHIAVWKGNLEVVKLLVEAGADLMVQSDGGSTPLSMANFNDARLQIRTYFDTLV
jgi:uncharacterized protein